MKAEFKKSRTADRLPLTVGKMYDVLDVKAGKRPWKLKEIKVKNDLGQGSWYKANKFTLFAEAAAFLKEPTVVGAGQSAAQSVTPDGAQMIQAADAAAGFTVLEGLEIGKAIAVGIADGSGLTTAHRKGGKMYKNLKHGEVKVTTTISFLNDGEIETETQSTEADAQDDESDMAAGYHIYSDDDEEMTEEEVERYAVASDLADVCEYLEDSEVIKVRLIVSKAQERKRRTEKQ